MAIISFTLILVSLQTLVDASQVTFTKHDGKVFVGTDSKHYAMYGQVTDKTGVRVIVVDDDNHYYQSSTCEKKWQELASVDPNHLKSYQKIREEYSSFKDKSPAISGVPTDSYSWSCTLSEGERKYSTVRLDDGTSVFSSSYFPGKLAKLISSGDIVIFVHYDGRVVLKTYNCLYRNERILINAIHKSFIDKGKLSMLIPTRDKALKNYLEKSKLDEFDFEAEQNFLETYTAREMVAMQRALMGQGSIPLNGYRV